VNVLYFAWVKEKVGVGEESVNPPSDVATVADLMTWLSARSPGHAAAFADRKLVKAAVDQVHSPLAASVRGAKEVAFFPPVTGG
jgi:molybdopterin synthase sulfur carrier subunit